MGLRINSNISSMIALRNLNATDSRQARSFEKLATGLRIVRPQDDPTGLAVSESLRAQTRALKQVTENARSAEHLMNTADAALSNVSDILNNVRRSVLAAMNDSMPPEAISSEQDFIDEAIETLGRFASTTRFGDIPLLDGRAGFEMESIDTQIRAINAEEVRFNPVTEVTDFSVGVTTSATQASLSFSAGVTGGDAMIEIQGPDGTATVHLADGTPASGVATAINSLREFTGIFSSGTTDISTEEYGSDATIRIRNISGSGTVGPLPPGGVTTAQGVDVEATFMGESFTGKGNRLSLDTEGFRGTVELMPDTPSGTDYTFSIRRSGLLLQMGIEANFESQLTVGISSINPDHLGIAAITIGGEEIEGLLSSLHTGGGNDLVTNPENALRILDRAMRQISEIRGSLGSVSQHILQPTQRFNEVAIENLTAAESSLRDLDFAAESAEMARNQILFQAGTSVLASASTLPQTILELLK
jgi:flagellin